MAVLAITGGSGFWRDPERIGITVLGAIGIITFLTEMAVTTYVAKTGNPFVFGATYSGAADFTKHLLGFVFVCALTPWVKVRWNWKLAWYSLVLFVLYGLALYSFHFRPVQIRLPWLHGLLHDHSQSAKLIQTGISVTGLSVAILIDLWKRTPVGWLVIVASIGMIVGQVAMHVRDAFVLY